MLRVRESRVKEREVEQEQKQELEPPFCEAYNLILTGRWMMAVPRTAGKFDDTITVNGLGEM